MNPADKSQLNSKGHYHGPCVFYYFNGEISSKGTFDDGKRVGYWLIGSKIINRLSEGNRKRKIYKVYYII